MTRRTTDNVAESSINVLGATEYLELCLLEALKLLNKTDHGYLFTNTILLSDLGPK